MHDFNKTTFSLEVTPAQATKNSLKFAIISSSVHMRQFVFTSKLVVNDFTKVRASVLLKLQGLGLPLLELLAAAEAIAAMSLKPERASLELENSSLQ